MRDGMDAALEIVHRTGPEYGPGASNHAPMAVEAMLAMGRGDGIIPWLEWYGAELEEPPRGFAAIPRDGWREYLGKSDRVADWVSFFDGEIAEFGWQRTLTTWVPRFASAIVSRAAHGLIRTAHAARSLSVSNTAPRRHELAQGLGYWASTWQTLPGEPDVTDSLKFPSNAVERLCRLHEPGFVNQGLIWQSLLRLHDEPSFAGAIRLARPGPDVSGFLSNLTETAASWYLSDRTVPIVFVHTVTAPSALRFIAPYLVPSDLQQAARYAWQACAAMYAWFAMEDPKEPDLPRQEAPDLDDLRDRAVAAAGPHSIKFVEACLREYELNPNPVYLAAADDAIERVGSA